MEGIKTELRMPVISHAQVIGYDSENNAVWVQMPSGQALMLSARMLYHGTADAIRVHQVPLPYIGSWGLVCLPYGDDRFPIWLGSYYPNVINAITSSSSLEDSQVDYYSHASGFYSLLDSVGQLFYYLPDGTQILVNSTNIEPQTYRHNVDETQNVQRILFPDSERNLNPPTPFYITVRHPTGTTAMITPTGIIHLDTGGQVEQASQGPIFELNPLSSGTTAPSGTPAGGAQLIGQAGLSSVYLDKDGNITITSTGSSTQILVSANGDVTINSLDGDVNVNASSGNVNIDAALDILLTTNLLPGVPGIMSVNDLITKYNQHNHFVENVQTGSSQVETTGPENVWKLP